MTQDHKTAVLVVGGGITGLSTALFLARQGVNATVIERHPSTAVVPQARAFNPRSMEIFRALGLEPEIRDRTSILVDMPEMIGAETLLGEERFRLDVLAQVRPPATLSPTDWGMIDQDDLELVVRAAAEQSGADIRFSTELVSVSSGADGVSAVMRDLGSGSKYGIEADYLVAADGHRAGVRNKLGIGTDGPGVLTKAVYFVFDADLTTALRGRRFLLGYLNQPTAGTALVPLRQHGRWLLGVPYHPEAGESPDDYSEERCIEMARLAVGDPELEVTLVQSMPGIHKVSTSTIGAWVAQRYRSGRIFFAGDAAHVVPPTGSYGANTGIADAHNIAWKLAAVIKRQAGAALLDTYEEERRPVAQKTLETALHLLHDRHEGEGDDVATVDNLAMIFGYRYESPAILTEAPAPEGLLEDPRVPSGRPGFRAPHVWLDRAGVRVSTIDLFGGAFSLLVGTEGADWSPAAKAVADAFGIDLVVHQLGTDLQDLEGQFLDAYGLTASGATLVRPDGFVAWRSPELPFQPARDLGQVFTQLLGVTSSAAGSSATWS